jgi:hypothetical protein
MTSGHGEGSEAYRRANEAVASRFSLDWNAATSKWGLAADLVVASAAVSVAVFFLALSVNFGLTALAWVFAVLAAIPLVTVVVANVLLRKARSRVVAWMASLPFAVQNMNCLLAGFGEEFEVYFEGAAPARDVLMQHFSTVSDDVFVLETHEDQKMVRARLGVIVSKHNPRQAQLRFARFTEVVERSLLPLHAQHPIRHVLLC